MFTSPTATYTLPAKFYDDHVSRDLEAGKEIRRKARRVVVELDRDSYDELLNDAEYYSDRWGPSGYEGERSMRRSAERTVQILKENGAPATGGSIPWDRSPGRHTCYLPHGETVRNLTRTNDWIHGPAWLHWRVYADGGVDATYVRIDADMKPCPEAIFDMRKRYATMAARAREARERGHHEAAAGWAERMLPLENRLNELEATV